MPSAVSKTGGCSSSSSPEPGISTPTLFISLTGISSHGFCSILYTVSVATSFVYVNLKFVSMSSKSFCTYIFAGIKMFVPSIKELCSYAVCCPASVIVITLFPLAFVLTFASDIVNALLLYIS